MHKIVVVGNEKGGVGKSTLAMNLAVTCANKGLDTLLVDGDTQTSSRKLSAIRAEEGVQTTSYTCASITGKGLAQEVLKLVPKFDRIIIDCGGRDSQELRSAMTIADVLVTPVGPSQLDVQELPTMCELLRLVEPINPNLKAYLVINKADTNPMIQDTQETLEFLQDFPEYKVLGFTIGARKAFREAPKTGLVVCELQGNKRNQKAIDEIEQLYCEIYKEDADAQSS